MRPGQNKRMRGGRPGGRFKGGGGGGGGGGPNRSFDSTGPDVKLRGTAPQLYEKYLALARDANAAGDRVAAESYLQHAEHYYRVMLANGFNPHRQQQQQPNGNGQIPGQGQPQGGQPGQPHQQGMNPAAPGAPQPTIDTMAPMEQPSEQPDAMFAEGDLDHRY